MVPKKMARNTSRTPLDITDQFRANDEQNHFMEKSPVVVPEVDEAPLTDPPPDRNLPQFSNMIKQYGDGRSFVNTKDGFSVTLGKNGDDRMRSEWGLSDFGDKKKPIDLEVPPHIEAKINELDDHAERTFKDNGT